jgi:hypothetical protein
MAIFSIIALFLFATAAQAQSCKLEVSKHDETILFSKIDIETLLDGNIIDAPISTFRNEGKNVWILPTARQYNKIPIERLEISHRLMSGKVKSPHKADFGEFFQKDFMSSSTSATSGTQGYKWITNTYQTPEGVLGFVHSEYTAEGDHWHMSCDSWVKLRVFCAPGNSKIGLAWMPTEAESDKKPHFVYLGHIAGFTGERKHFNVHGVPWYINTEDEKEYLNIVFHDTNARNWGQIARARSPLSEVLAAAKAGHTTKWEKFNDGAWEDALTGKSSSILPLVPELRDIAPKISRGEVIVHSDAIKHKETGRYFLSAYTLKHNGLRQRPSRLVFYDSCDGINWRFNGYSNERDDGDWGWSYLTFVDDDGSDNGMASGAFNLIAGFDYGRPKKRVELMDVTVLEGCTCPSP